MSDEPDPAASPPAPPSEGVDSGGDEAGPERARIPDFVRRAMSAGFEAASKSKDDLLRVASSEIRSWLDRLDLDTELKKALSKMVVEIKTEIRFRPTEDGQSAPEVSHDVRLKTGGKG